MSSTSIYDWSHLPPSTRSAQGDAGLPSQRNTLVQNTCLRISSRNLTSKTCFWNLDNEHRAGGCPLSVYHIPLRKNLSSLWSSWVPPSVTIGAATFPMLQLHNSCSPWTWPIPPLNIPLFRCRTGHGKATLYKVREGIGIKKRTNTNTCFNPMAAYPLKYFCLCRNCLCWE